MTDFFDPDFYDDDDDADFAELFSKLQTAVQALTTAAISEDLAENYDIYCLVTSGGNYYPKAGTLTRTIPGWVLFTDDYSGRGDKIMVDLRNVQAVQYTPKDVPPPPVVLANAA